MLMENCPAKFTNLTTLFQRKSRVTFNNFWILIHNWRKITVPHEDTSENVLLPPNEPYLFRYVCESEMMSSNEQTEERVSRGFIQRSVLTAPLILATCSNTQTSINSSSSGPRSLTLTLSESAAPAGAYRCSAASRARSLPANANRHAKQIVLKCLEKAALFAPGPNKIIFTSYPVVIRAERIEFPWQ